MLACWLVHWARQPLVRICLSPPADPRHLRWLEEEIYSGTCDLFMGGEEDALRPRLLVNHCLILRLRLDGGP